jgi:hypothetical protein
MGDLQGVGDIELVVPVVQHVVDLRVLFRLKPELLFLFRLISDQCFVRGDGDTAAEANAFAIARGGRFDFSDARAPN